MQTLIHKEEKKLRVEKKLKSIEELYNLAIQEKGKPSVKMKDYRGEFVLSANKEILIKTAKQLVVRIKKLNKTEEGKPMAERLTQVHIQIVDLIKSEYTNIRNRNNRISTIQE